MTLKLVPRKLEGVISGVTRIPVTITNLFTGETFTTDFLVDTGYWETMVPASQLKRIGIDPEKRRTYERPDGKREDYDIGIAELSFLEERVATHILFAPEITEPRLGRFTLTAAGLSIDQKHRVTNE